MTDYRQILQSVLSGRADANIRFEELCNLLRRLGFEERNRGGSHHVFRKAGTRDKINLQSEGGRAKPYQVRQVRKILITHGYNEREV
jgi:hypothetical protein